MVLMTLTGGTKLSLLVVVLGAACWSVMVRSQKDVNKILADSEFWGKDGNGLQNSHDLERESRFAILKRPS